MKPVEDRGQLLFRYADAGIRDLEFHHFIVRKVTRGNGHVAHVGKFKGIVNEIIEDVFELSPVAVERWKVRRKRPMEPYIFGQRVFVHRL